MPVRPYQLNGTLVNRTDQSRRLIQEAYHDIYQTPLRDAVYEVLRYRNYYEGDMYAFFTWLYVDNQHVSNEVSRRVDGRSSRLRSEGAILPGADPMTGSNFLYFDIPEKYAVTGQTVKAIHTDDRDTIEPNPRLPRMENAVVRTPSDARRRLVVTGNGREQSFQFRAEEAGKYEIMAFIRHPDGHIETLWQSLEVKSINAVNTEAFNASVGQTASPSFNQFRTSLELAEMGMEAQNSRNLEEMRRYQAVVDEQTDLMNPATIVPIGGVFTDAQRGANVRLSMYMGIGKNPSQRFVLADLTPGSGRRPYTGQSVNEVIDKFRQDNTYPPGILQFQNPRARNGIDQFSVTLQTDGRSFLQGLSEGFGWASLGLAAAGLLASVIPGGQVAAPWLFLASGAAGAGSGALSLADQFKNAELSSTSIAIDVLSIVGSLLSAGGAARALRVGSNAFRVANMGSYVVLPGLAVDGASTLLISAEAYRGVVEIRNSNLPEGEKIARITRIIATVSANAGLLALDARSSVGSPRRIEGGPTGASPRVDEDNWMYERGGVGEMIAAARFYNRMENLVDGSDVAAIVTNTGLPDRVVRRVRSHVFDEVHDIAYTADNGEFRRETGGFSADVNIAPLWRDAMQGDLSPERLADFTDLLAHEYLESRLMQAGLPFRDAISVQRGSVQPGDGFGAHNLSFNTSYSSQLRNGRDVSPFAGWAEYGLEYRGPALARDLSNIDEVYEAIQAAINQRRR